MRSTNCKDPQFRTAASGVLIEERLDGVEVSVIAITDGRTIVTLPPLRTTVALDGDRGPNMVDGAFALLHL